MIAKDFQEIGHCGGQIELTVKTNEEGRRSYQIGIRHSRPTAAALFGIYVLRDGVPAGTIQLEGIGQPWNQPPHPNCIPAFISSDREGRFGHECPNCSGYWRSGGAPSRWVMTCPYCGLQAECHHFLTQGQLAYIQAYCDLFNEALASDTDGEHVIDMDKVADAVGTEVEKPKFYYAEESQQNRYTCASCGDFNDILGTYGYCSCCGTRNDLQELEGKTIRAIRERIANGGPYEACVKDAVTAFDAFGRQYAKQLAQRVPMRPARRSRLEKMLFHNLKPVTDELKATFDIDLFSRLTPEEIELCVLMFHRRHVYEHNGGEADEKYIRDSGDMSVRPKQALRETRDSAQKTTELVVKMARNLHTGFHDIFPPQETPINLHKRQRRPGESGA